MNTLYYGDNLNILRKYIKDETVDLVYLDPPFNSNRSYNVLFKEAKGIKESAAQISAFEDTWQFTDETTATLHEMGQTAPPNLVQMMNGLVQFLGDNELTAYLVMMAARLVELHRVLKPNGTLFLHCDPTASHYLKIILDQIFGKDKMINEIIWKRTTGHGDAKKRMGSVHDVILWYAKGNTYVYNRQFSVHDEAYVADKYRYVEEKTGRKYSLDNLTSPSPRPNLTYEYKGYPPPANGWRVSKERMAELDAENRLYFPSEKHQRIRLKRYLDEMEGVTLTDVWTDISPLNSQAKEALGYPTQKPVALLERIVKMASNPGDVVLDPFCGCGTTIAAAQALRREWIGIDVTHIAIDLIEKRLTDMYPDIKFETVGRPKDTAGAQKLFEHNAYEFEAWALSKVEARHASGKQKKGADRGVDGVRFVHDNPREADKKVVVQVKGGKVDVSMIRDFAHVIDREQAAMGLFLCLKAPTAPMLTEAAKVGVYEPTLKTGRASYPKLQILTIDDLFAGKQPQLPTVNSTFKSAEAAGDGRRQLSLDEPTSLLTVGANEDDLTE